MQLSRLRLEVQGTGYSNLLGLKSDRHIYLSDVRSRRPYSFYVIYSCARPVVVFLLIFFMYCLGIAYSCTIANLARA